MGTKAYRYLESPAEQLLGELSVDQLSSEELDQAIASVGVRLQTCMQLFDKVESSGKGCTEKWGAAVEAHQDLSSRLVDEMLKRAAHYEQIQGQLEILPA